MLNSYKHACVLGLLLSAFTSTGVFAQESLPFIPEEPPVSKPARTAENIAKGKAIYIKRCLPCHGENGASDGPVAVFLDPRPRDFRRGILKIKTTVWDAFPTDEDHFRILTRGIPGTAMPSWKALLSEEERWQVVFYEQASFFPKEFDPNTPREAITVPAEPPTTPEGIAKGKEIFEKVANCFICHGSEGRGDGAMIVALKDIWGNPVLPRNLTQSWKYKGGNEAKQIFTRITTGIFSSGMPSFSDKRPDNPIKLSDEQRWDVAHYVKSLQKQLKEFKDVIIKPKLVAGEISLDPNDKIWDGVDYIDVPLSGQVTAPPRNQHPSIDLLSVRTIYNGKDVAFLLEYDDRRPNTIHEEPLPGFSFMTEGVEPEAKEKRKTKSYETYPVLYPPDIRPQGPYRDAVAIQVAVKIPDSPELPHFLLGSKEKPVNLYYWKADVDDDPTLGNSVEVLMANGHKNPVTPIKTQSVSGKGAYSNGHWKVVMKRPMVSDDPATFTPIESGTMVPISFHAWDGFNGEVGLRRSVSSWYFLFIEKSVPPAVYVYSGLAVVIAGALEIFFIKRARKKK